MTTSVVSVELHTTHVVLIVNYLGMIALSVSPSLIRMAHRLPMKENRILNDSPAVFGTCQHIFHMHCILKWVNTPSSQQQCPLDRRPWGKSALETYRGL